MPGRRAVHGGCRESREEREGDPGLVVWGRAAAAEALHRGRADSRLEVHVDPCRGVLVAGGEVACPWIGPGARPRRVVGEGAVGIQEASRGAVRLARAPAACEPEKSCPGWVFIGSEAGRQVAP